jgi:protein-disulfide isomerase/uncharacterized membrane protein
MIAASRIHVTGIALAGFGWLVSGALLLRGLALAGRGLPGVARILPAGCDEILASPSSIQLGLPMAGWGIVYFAVLAFLWTAENTWSARAALLISAMGCGVGVLLIGVLFSTGAAPCLGCLTVHAINFALVAAAWLMLSAGRIKPQPRRWISGSIAMRTCSIVCAALVGGSLQAALFRDDSNFRMLLTTYETSPRSPIPVQADDASLGPADAPVRIVIFSSFQCPACQAFDTYLTGVRQLYGDQVRIIYKHFPLGTACNPILKTDQQPRACAAAYAAEAARRQGAFWPYERALFAGSLAASDELLLAAARGAGVDLARWESDRRSPETIQKVRDDAVEGAALRIEGTPGVFINGRKAPQVSMRLLGLMISRELASARK